MKERESRRLLLPGLLAATLLASCTTDQDIPRVPEPPTPLHIEGTQEAPQRPIATQVRLPVRQAGWLTETLELQIIPPKVEGEK